MSPKQEEFYTLNLFNKRRTAKNIPTGTEDNFKEKAYKDVIKLSRL